jgi:nucleoside-diphosphate-sugar epimerase
LSHSDPRSHTGDQTGEAQLILVTGGAGYIGCILVDQLLSRGYDVRILDRLYWGSGPLGTNLGRVDLVVADVREVPETALDGVAAVVHLAGMSNDPTSEFRPEATWEVNAIATESLARQCAARDINRFVFTSSASLYDGLSPGAHDENAPINPRGTYAESKHYGELALTEIMRTSSLCPVILRNGTVFGYSPRMRFDLVINTFLKDALLRGVLNLDGGGWMWRPLVDVTDVAGAIIAAIEAPAEVVRGEAFNVTHSNYLVRELAMLVESSVRLIGRDVRLTETPLRNLTRDYALTNDKLINRLGYTPTRSVLDSVADMLSKFAEDDGQVLTDPRNYNMRWLELLDEVRDRVQQFESTV